MMTDSKAENIESEDPELKETGTEAPEMEGVETDVQSSEPEDSRAEEVETDAPEELEETEVTEEVAPEPAKVETEPGLPKKLLLWAAIVIAALFLLLGLASVVGVWAVNTPVTNTVLAILQPIDNALHRLEAVSGEVATTLSTASASLDEADQRVQELGAGLAETNLVKEALTRILDVDLKQKVGKANDSVRSIYDTVVAVEETINTINAIPFLSLEVPGSEEMASIRIGMEEMATSAQELRQENQQRREDRAENLVAAITTPLDRLNGRVDEMQSRMTNAEARFGQAIERMDDLQGKVPGWIDMASIVATLLLAWLMFSQGAVIVLCWRALHVKPRTASA
jgi:signal transduction histidine kinase